MSDEEELVNEVRVLYQLLVQLGEELHKDTQISMGMRAVLEYLDREGATTVPNMARARSVTRQRIQTLVNDLDRLALVEAVANPASQRSPLIEISAEGKKTIRQMRRKEKQALNLALPEGKARYATETLRLLRTQLMSR